MSRKKKLRPIHVKVGAEEWLTTFADMMTLLLVFFILLFSLSQIEAKKVFQLRKSFEKYFGLDVPTQGYSSRRVDLPEIPTEIAKLGAPERKVDSDEGRSLESQEAEAMDRYASLSKDESFHPIIIQGEVTFSPGTATVLEDAKPSLLRIAARLRRFQNRIKVLGHTSPLPVDPDVAADHDDLGYRRAKAIGRFLSGGDGELNGLARKLLPALKESEVSQILSVDPARFIYATRGDRSPVSRGKLWEDVEQNDRVELVFLPDAEEGAD